MNKLVALVLCLNVINAFSATVIEVEIIKGGREYECLQDIDTGKVFNCHLD